MVWLRRGQNGFYNINTISRTNCNFAILENNEKITFSKQLTCLFQFIISIPRKARTLNNEHLNTFILGLVTSIIFLCVPYPIPNARRWLHCNFSTDLVIKNLSLQILILREKKCCFYIFSDYRKTVNTYDITMHELWRHYSLHFLVSSSVILL